VYLAFVTACHVLSARKIKSIDRYQTLMMRKVTQLATGHGFKVGIAVMSVKKIINKNVKEKLLQINDESSLFIYLIYVLTTMEAKYSRL